MSAMLIAASVFVAHVSAARLDLHEAEGAAAREAREAVEATRVWLAMRPKALVASAAAADAPLPRLRHAAEGLIAAARDFAHAARSG
jgi:hypothetical protein